MRSISFFVFSFLFVLALFLIILPKFSFSADYGDMIIDSLAGEPSILIPMLASDVPSHAVAGLIFNGLVKYDKDLRLIGDLAQSWQVSDDGLEITFYLRRGVKWHDGIEFTARDIMFGYETIIDDRIPTAYKEDFLQVQSAKVLDDYTFRVVYAQPFAPALSSWGNLVVLPEHILRGKDITKSDFGRNPIGTGPFKFTQWIPGQKIVLDANADYFDGAPYISKYVFRVIPDSATMFMELKAGGIDYMGLSPVQFMKQTDAAYFKNNFQKFRYPSTAYTYLGFNLKHPWFKDRRVREAFAYAIDKQEVVRGVLFGLGAEAVGPYVPDTWPYNPNLKKREYNPEKAKQLLDECGWQDTNNDGILDKDGRAFEFTVLTNMGNSSRMKAAAILQWRLSAVGIKMNIRAVEWATFINEFIDKRRFEAVILGWSISLDPDQYDIWHSTKVSEKEFNFIGYKNMEVDLLLERGRGTFDIEERKKIYYRLQEILADDLPYIFLYVPDATPIVHSRFQGIAPAPIGIGYNINEWFVPKNKQKYN